MTEMDLQELRERFPLPGDIPDEVVNRSQLAFALDVSEPTLTKYLAQGMPCIEEGGNGREYSFGLGDCYAWRMAREEELRIKKRNADSAAQKMASLFRNLEEDEPQARMSAKQIAEEADAEWRWQKAAEGRRELIRAAKVRELFENALNEVRNSWTAIPDFAEMEFGLTPEQVAKLEARCDAVLSMARQDLEKMLAAPGEVVDLAERVSGEPEA